SSATTQKCLVLFCSLRWNIRSNAPSGRTKPPVASPTGGRNPPPPAAKSLSRPITGSRYFGLRAVSACVLRLEDVGCAFADDDAGGHGVAGGNARHDRPVGDTKAFCSIDFQL